MKSARRAAVAGHKTTQCRRRPPIRRRTALIKGANIKKVILRSKTLPKCQCTAEQYHLF